MIKYLKIYFQLQLYHLKRINIYKLDFWIGIIAFACNQLFSIITLLVIYTSSYQFNHWNMYEVLFLQGFVSLVLSIGDLLTDNLWNFAGVIINRGEMDRYLTCPLPPLLSIISERFQIESIGGIIVSCILLCIASTNLANLNIILFFIVLIASTLMLLAIKIIVCSTAFRLKKSRALLYLTFKFLDFCKYPLTIYPFFLRLILSTILPFALASYYPVVAVFNNYFWMSCGLLVVAIFLFMLSIKIWNRELRWYTSSGS